MKAVVVAVLLSASPALAERQIVDNNAAVTVDCKKDSEVTLVGNNLTVTLVGSCTRVNVTGNREKVTGSATTFFVGGNHNTITAETTDDITVAGSHNTVTWKKSGKGSPKVANPGKDNKVTQAP
jgi:DUF3060 family protein